MSLAQTAGYLVVICVCICVGLQQSGQISGRDLSSSHIADAAHWRPSASPAMEPATAADSRHLPEPMSSAQQPAAHPPLPHSFPHTVHHAAAAPTEQLMPPKASSSLLADLRQAQEQQRQQQQQHQCPQPPHEHLDMSHASNSAEQQAQNLKRSSRQAAKAAEQAIQAAQAILSPQHPQQQYIQQQQQPQQQQLHQPVAESDAVEPQLQWGLQRRAVRVRGHRHPALKAGMLFSATAAATLSLRVASGGVSKPSVSRHQDTGAQVPLFRQPAPAFPVAAAAAVPRRFEQEASMAARDAGKAFPGLASLAQAAGKQGSGEGVSAFTPRHSRKKVLPPLGGLHINYVLEQFG